MNAALVTLLATMTLTTPTLEKDDASGVFPYPVQRAQLENGMKVLMIPMPSEGLVSYWSVVRTGSRDEVEPGVTGFAHFFEHMMFRGSEKFPGPVYDGIVNAMGAKSNAFTDDDITAYHLSFTKADLPKVIEVEADRFQNLKYSEEDFKTESGAVYGEYRKSRTSPFSVLYEALQEKAFDVHTYKHTTIGFEADIKRMPEQFDYSKTFFQRFYRPENVVVMVIGDFDATATLETIRKHYGPWKKGYVAPKVPVEPEQKGQRRLDVSFEGRTLPILAVTYKGDGLKPGDAKMMAGPLAGEIAFGQTSDIYKKLVLDEQRVEFIAPSFGFSRDPGLWSILARVKDPADVRAVEAEIFETVKKLQSTDVDDKRLADVRSRLKYEFLSGLSTPHNVAESLCRFIAMTGDMTAVEEMYETLDRVTAADVKEAAAHYLTPERSTVTVLHTAGESVPDSAPAAKSATPADTPKEAAKASSPPPAPKKSNAKAGAVKVGAEPPVLLPVKEDPNVAIQLWFQVGSQDDPPGKEGLAALTAALVSDGGSRTRPYDQILAELFPLATSYAASVDKEMTIVSGTVHRDLVDRFVPILLDAVVDPGFREEDFTRLKDTTISGIEKSLRYSSDEDLGKAALHARLFEGSRYAHLVDGSVAALNAITLEDVRAFHAKFFTRDNVVVGLAGAYSDVLPGSLSGDLGALPGGKPERVPPPKPAPLQGRELLLVEKPGPSTAISFGFPIDLARGSRDFYALWIANSWLGEHRNSSSHLYQVIREARGMNYGDYSYIEAYPNGGRLQLPPTGVSRRGQIFEVWIRPVPRAQAHFALRAGLREVEALVANGLTEKQFAETREFLSKYVLHFAETTSQRLGYAIDDRFYDIDDGHLARFQKMLASITRDEVNAAVKKYIRPDDMVIALVTEGATELRDAILAETPSPMSYGTVPKPKEILEEDKLIERYPVRIKKGGATIVPVDQMFEK